MYIEVMAMTGKNPKVDLYLQEGCMRCELGGTPDCKVHTWATELKELRRILLETELTEEVKWSVPCFTYNGKNILLMSALKDASTISFFKGALLKDPAEILTKPGKNTQAARYIKFTNIEEIIKAESIIKDYVASAIEVEKAGLKIEFKETSEFDIPAEFQTKLEEDPALKLAFESLTPGRQRGYLLYFSGAKQSKTRTARVEKNISKIMEGKGFHDR
jgi:uncharacterized protein YdeI (YjbR/CyaY-like superfamily)